MTRREYILHHVDLVLVNGCVLSSRAIGLMTRSVMQQSSSRISARSEMAGVFATTMLDGFPGFLRFDSKKENIAIQPTSNFSINHYCVHTGPASPVQNGSIPTVGILPGIFRRFVILVPYTTMHRDLHCMDRAAG